MALRIRTDYRKSKYEYTPEELEAIKKEAYEIFDDMERVRKMLRLKNRENVYMAFRGRSHDTAFRIEQLIKKQKEKLAAKIQQADSAEQKL